MRFYSDGARSCWDFAAAQTMLILPQSLPSLGMTKRDSSEHRHVQPMTGNCCSCPHYNMEIQHERVWASDLSERLFFMTAAIC